jgi:HAD superfamily hydrolase (TIGR01509 family)
VTRKAVVFDLDGTLVDTMATTPAAYADTVRQLGGPPVAPADVIAVWHIGPKPEVLAHFLGRAVGDDDMAVFYRNLEKSSAAVRAFPGILALVEAMAGARCRLGVVTSATRRAATLMLTACGLDRTFSAVVTGDDVTQPKPAPQGLIRACGLLRVSPTATLFVGDAAVDLRCATAAGATPVHAVWSVSASARPGPHATVRRPADVLRLIRSAEW